MKKFFLNKKLMTAVLSLSLVLVIGGIAVFAAFQSGLPGIEKILGGFEEPDSESSSSEEEILPEENPEFSGVVIDPIEPEENNPQIENVVEGPIVYRAPERMMAITLVPGVDYCTEEGMSADGIKKSIDTAIADAKALSANTIFFETTFGETVIYSSEKMPQTKVSIDMLGYGIEKAKA